MGVYLSSHQVLLHAWSVLSACVALFTHLQTCERGVVLIPILQMSSWRLVEVKPLLLFHSK